MNESAWRGHRGACFLCDGAHDPGEHDSGAHGRGLARRSFLATAAAAPATALLAPPAAAQPAPSDPLRGTYALQPDWVLARRNGGLELVRDTTVVVRGDTIEAVQGEPARGMPVRRLAGQLLLPGFISGHTHVCSASPTRGLIEGGRSFARPLELVETLDDEDLDALTAFNLTELFLGGCTTQVEMSLSLRQAQSYVRVAERLGARGYVGGMVPGIARLFPIWFRRDDAALTTSVPGTLAEIADNLAFARRLKASGYPRIQPMLAPHATDTHTPETMAALLAGARELGTGLQIHLSQSARETETVKRLWGSTPAAWLEGLGFVDMPVFAAHMTGIEGGDLEVLRRAGYVFAHCPSAGGAGRGGGLQPYPEALAAGVRTAMGIDTHSNDYLENVKLAVLLGRLRGRMLQAAGSRQAIRLPTVWSAVEGATLAPADALRRPDLGRIEPGAKADLVAVDVSGFLVGAGATPPEPMNNLLYAAGRSVREVFVDGVHKVADGRFIADDETAIARRGGEVVQKLWRKLEAEDWFKPTAR